MSSSATPAPPSPAAADDAAAPDSGADVAAFYQRADALYRCAVECCRQHERAAHLGRIGALPAERRAAQTLVSLCDDALEELVGSYERAAARARPSRDDACWHAANGLWLASREFARRTRTSTRRRRCCCSSRPPRRTAARGRRPPDPPGGRGPRPTVRRARLRPVTRGVPRG